MVFHKEREKTSKKPHTMIFFSATLGPLQDSLCLRFFLHFEEKTQPEHKEFRGLKAPEKVDSGMGFSVKSLCLGVFFGPDFKEEHTIRLHNIPWVPSELMEPQLFPRVLSPETISAMNRQLTDD